MDRLRFTPEKKLHEVLGLDCPMGYEQLVDVLPHTQLVSIDSTFRGEGAHGTVYKAKWARPHMSYMPGLQEVTVALKALKTDDPDQLKRFFREVVDKIDLEARSRS